MVWCNGRVLRQLKNGLCQFGFGVVSLFLLTACSTGKQITVTAQPGQGANEPWVDPLVVKNSQSLRYTERQLARKEAPDYAAFTTRELLFIPEEAVSALEIRSYEADITTLEEKLEVKVGFFNADRGKVMEFEARTLFFREDDSLADYTDWVPMEAEPRQFAPYAVITASPYATKELVQIKNFRLVEKETF